MNLAVCHFAWYVYILQAAVPNWLREEIIKKKSSIPSALSTQPAGNSFDSIGSEDGDRSLRRADQSDSKSIDSTRSTEDEDDEVSSPPLAIQCLYYYFSLLLLLLLLLLLFVFVYLHSILNTCQLILIGI